VRAPTLLEPALLPTCVPNRAHKHRLLLPFRASLPARARARGGQQTKLKYKKEAVYITFLRDPPQRVMSQWRWDKSRKALSLPRNYLGLRIDSSLGTRLSLSLLREFKSRC
jgi:hypothetical protein